MIVGCILCDVCTNILYVIYTNVSLKIFTCNVFTMQLWITCPLWAHFWYIDMEGRENASETRRRPNQIIPK